jgi:hypothetical protein
MIFRQQRQSREAVLNAIAGVGTAAIAWTMGELTTPGRVRIDHKADSASGNPFSPVADVPSPVAPTPTGTAGRIKMTGYFGVAGVRATTVNISN